MPEIKPGEFHEDYLQRHYIDLCSLLLVNLKIELKWSFTSYKMYKCMLVTIYIVTMEFSTLISGLSLIQSQNNRNYQTITVYYKFICTSIKCTNLLKWLKSWILDMKSNSLLWKATRSHEQKLNFVVTYNCD